LELVGYPERCGYLDNVATVIAELAESIEADALEAEARRAPVAWVQRLGYLLALVEQDELAERLEGVLAASKVFVVPLAPRDANSLVEQDLIISRALVEMYSVPEIAQRLAFRGGTALYKLHLRPAARYSEDSAHAMAETIDECSEAGGLLSRRSARRGNVPCRVL
jgi:hypothetical protein